MSDGTSDRCTVRLIRSHQSREVSFTHRCEANEDDLICEEDIAAHSGRGRAHPSYMYAKSISILQVPLALAMHILVEAQLLTCF